MSVHTIDNKRRHRKIRCNSIEYDEGTQGYSESAYLWRSPRDLYPLGRARSNQEFYEGGGTWWKHLKATGRTCLPSATAYSAARWLHRTWGRKPTCAIRPRR